MPTVLTRDQILSADDAQKEFVPVPEWAPPTDPDAGVWVHGLSGTDRDRFDMSMIIQKGKKQELNFRNLRARLIALTAFDGPDPATARRLFEPADVEALGKKNAAALQRVYGKAQELSGLSNEAVEELTGELGEDSSGASGSSSLLPSGMEASPSVNGGSAPESSASGSPTTASSPSGIGA